MAGNELRITRLEPLKELREFGESTNFSNKILWGTIIKQDSPRVSVNQLNVM
jgi:hypothetical protein